MVLLSILDGLKTDFDFSVLIPKTGALTEELRKRNIPYQQLPLGYYSLGKKTLWDILSYLMRLPLLTLRLCSILSKEKPDLIYANAARTFVFATVAAAIKKIPLIWHVHSIFDKGISRRLCNYFGRAQIVKKVIVVSDAARLPLAALWPKTKILYNCIDEQVYYPGLRIGPIRKSFGISDNIVISMVGLLVEWKCVDDFIRAAQIVTESIPDIKFLIVGDVLYGGKQDSYKQYLMDMVEELGLEKNVIFTGFRNDVPDIMREIDIFVIASKKPDPCPTSLLQAMASGPAVIATNFGGPAEIIKQGVDGLLYTACDYHELAEKMLQLIENSEKRALLAVNAQKKIKEKFNYKDYLKKLKSVIESVIDIKDKDIYRSGGYARENPSWHKEDAKWKAEKIISLMRQDFLNKLTPGVDLIDIGCGTGEILKLVSGYLKEKNIEVNSVGYDISLEIIKEAKKNFPKGEFHSTLFDKNSYAPKQNRVSVALLIDILEHMEDPAAFLSAIREVCDYALCHLPLEDNFEVNVRGKKKHFTNTVGHINFYNKKSALELFKNCGFNIRNVDYTCSDVSADYKLKSLPRRLIAQPLRKIFFKFFPLLTANVLGNCSLMVLLEPDSNKGK
ncbi:MAG: glycosyltransferase [Candidatus Omnitrophota bacterium]